MPKLKNTLVWKLTTWFLLLSTFPVIVMMVFVRQSIHDTVSDLASENIISQAALLADQISSSGLQGEVKELLSNGSSESQTAFILDQEGKYLLHHDATKRGSSAFDDLPADLVRAILDDGKGAITEEGGNRIVGFSRVASSSSIAVLVSDGSVVSGPMQHLEKSAFFQIMVSLVIVAIAGAAAIWVMFNPIHKLARAAEEVGAGNLDLQVDPSDMEGELAVLTHSFNHMTEQLREAYDELEQRVEARTEELRNSQETERQMAEENALLTEIGRIVSSTLDIDEVYEQFALEMKRLVDFDRMAVNIIDQEAGVFVFKYASGIIQAGRQVPDIVPLANTQTQIVLESGRSLVQTDVTLAPHFSGTSTFLEMGLRSSIMVPLISNGVVTGTLSLRSRKVGAYGDRELSILERLANLVAPAIENAELYSQTRMAEGAMAESEERYRTLFQQSKDAILIASDGKIIEANQAVNEMLGYDADEAIGLDLEKVYVDLEDGSRLQEEISTHGSVKDFEVKLQRRDGSEIDCLVTATNLQTSAGTSLGIQGIIRDVTDRKQNEETLLQQTRELAVLAERNRMAREIHDTLAQGFTGIVLQMEAAEQASTGDFTEVLPHLGRAKNLARESLREARRSVWDLLPQALEQLPLESALQEEVRRYKANAGWETAEFRVSGRPRELLSAEQAGVLRVCQESLANALRHSAASEVVVTLAFSPEAVYLSIEDNGSGFDTGSTRVLTEKGGFGLTAMAQRAQLLGGTLNLSSRKGEGTVVKLTIPVAVTGT